MLKKKIGILGGTFDPPHLGHLEISKISIKKLKLKYLIWVITKKNPFKKTPLIPFAKRISLCKKMTKSDKESGFIGHLTELRTRLIHSIIFFFIHFNTKY